MWGTMLAGVEIGAVILAAAVLIAFILKPYKAEQVDDRPRCYFETPVIVGVQRIGHDECSGPAEWRWTYVVKNYDDLRVNDIPVCDRHVKAASERLQAIRELVESEATGA